MKEKTLTDDSRSHRKEKTMTKIEVYDYVAVLLEKKAEELETTVAEVVEELIIFLDDCE